jgi:DUF218 domain
VGVQRRGGKIGAAGEGQLPTEPEPSGVLPIADAIVVLGCRGSARLTRRLDHAIRLFRAGAAPLLLLSGGGTGPVPEAEIMRRMALARGVPEAVLLVELGSHDTVENARETTRLLRSRGGRAVLLVGDRAHFAAGCAAVPSRRPARRRYGRGAAAFDPVGDRRRCSRMYCTAEKPGPSAPPPGSR